jgi:AhpD family alkylhydroperoxidase
MPRLRFIDDSELTAPARALIENAKVAGAPDHRVISIYARTPMGVAFFEFWNRLMGESTALSLRLKELVRLRISVGKECGYCTSVRSNAAKAEGVDEALIAEMLDYEFSDRFTEQERLALWFADVYREDSTIIDDDEVWAKLKARFTDEQIIELGIFVGLNVGGSGFAKALKIVTWEEACELTPELQTVLKRKHDRKVKAPATTE